MRVKPVFCYLDNLTSTYPGFQKDDIGIVVIEEQEKIVMLYSHSLESDEFDWDNLEKNELHPIDINQMNEVELQYLYERLFVKPVSFSNLVKQHLATTNRLNDH